MVTAAMWVVMSAIATLCAIFIRITNYIAKLSSTETSMEAGNCDREQSKEDTPIMGDELGDPICSTLLCATFGVGVQNLLTLVALAVSSIPVLMGFMSRKYVTIQVMVASILFLLHGFMAGCTAVVLYKSMKGGAAASPHGWIKVSWQVALLSGWTFFSIRSIVMHEAFRVSLHDAMLMGLCVCISIPITLLGGYLGAQANPTHLPILTRRSTGAGAQSGNYRSRVIFLAAGSLASLFCGFETSNILISSWHISSQIDSWLLFAVSVLLMVSACNGWVVLNWVLLCSGNSHWWSWKPFFICGAPLGLYVFLRNLATPVFRLDSFSANFVCASSQGLITMITISTLGLILIFVIYGRPFIEPEQV